MWISEHENRTGTIALLPFIRKRSQALCGIGIIETGKYFCTRAIQVYDHDHEHLTEGKVIPHGIFDLKLNQGYISIGLRSETADFAVDNLLWWWEQHGIHQYPGTRNILLLCDAGGANSYRHLIFKHRLLKFAEQTGYLVSIALFSAAVTFGFSPLPASVFTKRRICALRKPTELKTKSSELSCVMVIPLI